MRHNAHGYTYSSHSAFSFSTSKGTKEKSKLTCHGILEKTIALRLRFVWCASNTSVWNGVSADPGGCNEHRALISSLSVIFGAGRSRLLTKWKGQEASVYIGCLAGKLELGTELCFCHWVSRREHRCRGFAGGETSSGFGTALADH